MIADALSYLRPHVDDWDAFVDACSRPLPTCIWRHPDRIGLQDVSSLLAEAGYSSTPVPWADDVLRLTPADGIGTSLPFLAGACHIQEEVSILAADLLGARPGERVLDMCAAPGGKTARIALTSMHNHGTIVANDRSPGRLRALRGNLDRLGVINASVTCFDATGYPSAAGTFDRILIDAPCSCSGTVRKHPGTLDECNDDSIRKLAGIQKAIMRQAVRLLRPGGVLLYTTCSFSPEENEAVVDRTLRMHNDLHLDTIRVDGFATCPGIREWGDNVFRGDVERCIRIYPHHNDTGGFFIARFRKGE